MFIVFVLVFMNEVCVTLPVVSACMFIYIAAYEPAARVASS